jgi:hypothetical protein
MRKLTLIAAVLVPLTVTGYAVANGIQGGPNPTAVTGTFTAGGKSMSSRTCTTSDGHTIVVSKGTYTGTSSGDPDFIGPITVWARSVVDTMSRIGLVRGLARIDVASGRDTQVWFTTVYNDGQIAGLAVGRAHDPRARVVANISAGFDPTTGFTDGKLGGGTNGGSAVELTPSACNPARSTHERSEAHGAVSLTSTSITVAGLTCQIPTGFDLGTNIHQGDVVEIHCAYENGTNTLVAIRTKGH